LAVVVDVGKRAAGAQAGVPTPAAFVTSVKVPSPLLW
jgi:hypothetical protein